MLRVFTSVAIVVATLIGGTARAQELSVAIGQRANWETSVSELGQQAGFFRKRGLVLHILYTQGSGETLQAVISGSVDIGIGTGVDGTLAAYSRGAPVRAIGAATTGASDLYWYVPASSPIKTLKDAGGKTVAYSTSGASTNLIAAGLIRYFNANAKLVATGGPAATFTQVMSRQIDVGWSSPPFGLEDVASGKIRIIARGSDAPYFKDQTVRLLIANARALDTKSDAIARYMQSYRETLEWMYTNEAAVRAYAAWAKIPQAIAARVRDEFYPRAALDPDRLMGFDQIMANAVQWKYLEKPLSPAALQTFIRIPNKG